MANKNSIRRKRFGKVKTGASSSRTVISANPKRNMAQVVYINKDADGKKYSITRHEPFDQSKGFSPYKRKKARVKKTEEAVAVSAAAYEEADLGVVLTETTNE